MRNTLGSIFLFLCLVAPITGAYLMLRVQKRVVRREIKHRIMRGISKKELVLLKFTPEQEDVELTWKHSKEFEYKNSMFDIVIAETHGDTTFYYCWWDAEETQLNRQLASIVESALGTIPNRNESKKKIHQFFKTLFFQNLSSLDSFCRTTSLNRTPYQFSQIEGTPHLYTPPPQSF